MLYCLYVAAAVVMVPAERICSVKYERTTMNMKQSIHIFVMLGLITASTTPTMVKAGDDNDVVKQAVGIVTNKAARNNEEIGRAIILPCFKNTHNGRFTLLAILKDMSVGSAWSAMLLKSIFGTLSEREKKIFLGLTVANGTWLYSFITTLSSIPKALVDVRMGGRMKLSSNGLLSALYPIALVYSAYQTVALIKDKASGQDEDE